MAAAREHSEVFERKAGSSTGCEQDISRAELEEKMLEQEELHQEHLRKALAIEELESQVESGKREAKAKRAARVRQRCGWFMRT